MAVVWSGVGVALSLEVGALVGAIVLRGLDLFLICGSPHRSWLSIQRLRASFEFCFWDNLGAQRHVYSSCHIEISLGCV